MALTDFLAKLTGDSQSGSSPDPTDVVSPDAQAGFGDDELLKFFKEAKKLSFDQRWVFERQWMRNIHYDNFRQWIYYVGRFNEWRDVRLAKWIPRPVTNKVRETRVSLMAMFATTNTSANARPIGSDPKNIAVAAIANEYEPIMRAEHDMVGVLGEVRYWFVLTGNAFLHTYLDRNVSNGVTTINFEQCQQCQAIYDSAAIGEAKGKCPDCGGMAWAPAMDPETGEPMTKQMVNGKGKTDVLSPFELAFPNTYARFKDVPYVIRLRWRIKSYYLDNPTLAPQVKDIAWAKSPSEESLRIFRSLPSYNDVGISPFMNGSANYSSTGSNSNEEEGIAEYEMWVRPCDAYPQGLVARFVGDSNPILLHQEEDEAIPGPLPYVDASGKPLFTFSHAAFDKVGGRVYGSCPVDLIIEKQNQLNRLDSMFLMIIQRMSNPLWLVPKGSEIEKFTGEPGLVVKWNPLTVGGNAKPERIAGEGPPGSFFSIREQYLKDIEDLAGTFDALKGSQPSGVDSFAGMQLLVERGQARFASAFEALGKMYQDWFKFALEIEREFGPDERTEAILSPARQYTFKTFKNANLQGSFDIVVEDGSNQPKTNLGTRAAIEHLNTLGALNMNDPDIRYKVYQEFGMTGLSPALDTNVQAALQKQEAFEEWAGNQASMAASQQKADQAFGAYQQQVQAAPPDPMTGQPQIPPPPSIADFTPLKWKPWYNATVHKQEFLKWANGDKVRALCMANEALENILAAALTEIENAVSRDQMAAMGMEGAIGAAAPQANSKQPGAPTNVPPQGAGAGGAMRNSNANAGATAGHTQGTSSQNPGRA